MKSVTESCVVPKPFDVVFDFLSNFDNMPRWSTKFVQSIKTENNQTKAVTPFGDMFVRIDSDRKTGVIDIFAGPTQSEMSPAYMRVISFSNDSCGVTFTFFQWPHTTDQMWEMFCDWIKIEVGNIKKLFS